jgi:exopolysaccharide production protein ExoY
MALQRASGVASCGGFLPASDAPVRTGESLWRETQIVPNEAAAPSIDGLQVGRAKPIRRFLTNASVSIPTHLSQHDGWSQAPGSKPAPDAAEPRRLFMSLAERVEASFVHGRRAPIYRLHLKRALDLSLVLAALPFVVPLILLLAWCIRRDGGPAFFGHERVGRDGRTFRCWKLRSMVPDSAAVLERHLAENPAAAAEWARDQKLAEDPRVTPIGRLLRTTSLDELPQLWNVVAGEMSLVGPRPVTAKELERYQGFEEDYLRMRPGLTGLWQVSGRNDVSYETRVRLDAEYAQRCSLVTDIGILRSTVTTVLRRTGR